MYTNLQKWNHNKDDEPKKRKFKKKEQRIKLVRIDKVKHQWLKVDATWHKITIAELTSRIIDFYYQHKKRDLDDFEVVKSEIMRP